MTEKGSVSGANIQPSEERENAVSEVFIDDEDILFCRLSEVSLNSSDEKDVLKKCEDLFLIEGDEFSKTLHSAIFYRGILLSDKKSLAERKVVRMFDINHALILGMFRGCHGSFDSEKEKIMSYGLPCYVSDVESQKRFIAFYSEMYFDMDDILKFVAAGILMAPAYTQINTKNSESILVRESRYSEFKKLSL